MGPKSSVQTIVMANLGSKYGQIRVKKRSFLPKNGQIDFFFVFLNSARDDDFSIGLRGEDTRPHFERKRFQICSVLLVNLRYSRLFLTVRGQLY